MSSVVRGFINIPSMAIQGFFAVKTMLEVTTMVSVAGIATHTFWNEKPEDCPPEGCATTQLAERLKDTAYAGLEVWRTTVQLVTNGTDTLEKASSGGNKIASAFNTTAHLFEKNVESFSETMDNFSLGTIFAVSILAIGALKAGRIVAQEVRAIREALAPIPATTAHSPKIDLDLLSINPSREVPSID